MKQKLLFLFIVGTFLRTTSLFAETPTGADFNWFSPKKSQPLLGLEYTFLSGNENLFYYYQYDKVNKRSLLAKYDATTNKTTSFVLKLKTEGVERDYQLTQSLNDSLYVFSSFKNKKQNKYYFFVENVDMKAFKLKNNPRMIAEIDYDDVKGLKSSDFGLWFSDDNKHFLISYTLQSRDGSILRYGFKVLDRQYNEIWKFEDDIPKVQGKWFLFGYRIDQNANVYMISRAYENEKDVNNHYERSKLYVKLINKDGTKGVDQELSLSGDKFITAQTFRLSKNNELICAGLYAKQGNESAVGNFSIVCKPGQTAIKSIDSRDFDKAFFTKGMNEKAAQKMEEKVDKNKDFENDFDYSFGKTMYRSDGGISYIIQKKKLTIQTYVQQGMRYTYYNYYYDDIIILTYNAEGKIMWVQKIPQTQKLMNGSRYYGSYVINIDNDDRMNFIYNLSSSAVTGIKAGSVKKTVCLSLDKDGKESFLELSDNEMHGFSPVLSVYLGDRRFLVGSVNIGFVKAKLNWGVMTLK
ncbi:MAG: hypothetical protein FWD60_12435 [Candidatus Azobacteroides sp.]|nr:hypothetical protein [Candidatus Azobacteroides sp.]